MFWLLIQAFFTKGFTLIVFVVLARLLEPEDFGLVAICLIFTSVAGVFVNSGLSKAIIQRKLLTDAHLNSAFWFNFTISFLFFILIAISSSAIGRYYQAESIALPLLAISFTIVISALTLVSRALLEKALNFKTLSICSIVSSVISGSAAIILAYLGFSYWSIVAQVLLHGLIDNALIWRFELWRPKINFDRTSFFELMQFGKGTLGSTFVSIVNKRFDHFLVGSYLGVGVLGVYSVGHRVFTTINDSLVIAINRWMFAKLSSSNVSHDGLCIFLKYNAWLFFPFFAVVFCNLEPLMLLVFGEKWAEAIPVAKVLLLVPILNLLRMPFTIRLLADGLSVSLFKIELVASIISAVVFFLVVEYGITVLASVFVARVVFLIIPFVFRLYFLHFRISFFQAFRRYACIYIPTLFSFAISYAISVGWVVDNSFLLLFKAFLSVLLSYVFVAFFCYVYDRDLFVVVWSSLASRFFTSR